MTALRAIHGVSSALNVTTLSLKRGIMYRELSTTSYTGAFLINRCHFQCVNMKNTLTGVRSACTSAHTTTTTTTAAAAAAAAASGGRNDTIGVVNAAMAKRDWAMAKGDWKLKLLGGITGFLMGLGGCCLVMARTNEEEQQQQQQQNNRFNSNNITKDNLDSTSSNVHEEDRAFLSSIALLEEQDRRGELSAGKREISKTLRWIVLGSIAGGFISLCAVLYPFVSPGFKGKFALPFVAASPEQLNLLERMIRHKSGRLVDLGSGDGRVVIAAAKNGMAAVGYELNPWLVMYSRWKAWRAGVSSRATFKRQDLWKVNDLHKFDTIIVFGSEEILGHLEDKIGKDMAKHAHVIACRFELPTWKSLESVIDPRGNKGICSAWLYAAPSEQQQQQQSTPISIE